MNIDAVKVWAFRLAKNGYGTITEIMNLDADTFMNLIHYENYTHDYQKAVTDLNKKS